VVFVVFGAEVELDRGAFEDAFGCAGGFVDDGWDAAVCWIGWVSCCWSGGGSGYLDGSGSEGDKRLIFRNQSSFCTFLAMSILCTLYFKPSSSSVQLIF